MMISQENYAGEEAKLPKPDPFDDFEFKRLHGLGMQTAAPRFL